MLEPGHERGMDHIRHPLSADGSNREIDVLQGETMGGDELERKALRRELLESELARLVAVAARLVNGDKFEGERPIGKLGNSAISPSTTIVPPLRFIASIPS